MSTYCMAVKFTAHKLRFDKDFYEVGDVGRQSITVLTKWAEHIKGDEKDTYEFYVLEDL